MKKKIKPAEQTEGLRDFFLTVVNYPISENTQKYIEAMRNIPETASHYDYVKWLYYGFERRLGREKIEGFFYDETKVYSLFTDKDFKSFEQNRAMLISGLDQVINGKDFSEIQNFNKIMGNANSILSREFFAICIEPRSCELKKTTYHPNLDDNDDELQELFCLACYGLVSFFTDEDRRRIKKCPICEKFFPVRDMKRKYCYSEKCLKEYRRLQKRKQRKVDPVKYIKLSFTPSACGGESFRSLSLGRGVG